MNDTSINHTVRNRYNETQICNTENIRQPQNKPLKSDSRITVIIAPKNSLESDKIKSFKKSTASSSS